ncbi:hypothetical protein KI387_030955, partial [Taxus chinensis]
MSKRIYNSLLEENHISKQPSKQLQKEPRIENEVHILVQDNKISFSAVWRPCPIRYLAGSQHAMEIPEFMIISEPKNEHQILKNQFQIPSEQFADQLEIFFMFWAEFWNKFK